MDFATPIGQEALGEAATFVDGNPEAGVEGSAVPAKAIEPGMRELIHLIRFAGMTPSGTDLEQVRKAISILIESASPGLATLLKNGISHPDGVTLKIDAAGKLSFMPGAKYDIGEFYLFRHPTLKPGMQPCYGGLISSAATQYPQIWAYLQTTDGQLLCKTESQWQALTTATWVTLANGTKFGWNGIGGAPYFVQDLSAGTLRMPDLRGMTPEAAGFDSLTVGGVHGDAIRNFSAYANLETQVAYADGIFVVSSGGSYWQGGTQLSGADAFTLNASLQVPTAAKNQTRAWGGLPCAYLGAPVA